MLRHKNMLSFFWCLDRVSTNGKTDCLRNMFSTSWFVLISHWYSMFFYILKEILVLDFTILVRLWVWRGQIDRKWISKDEMIVAARSWKELTVPGKYSKKIIKNFYYNRIYRRKYMRIESLAYIYKNNFGNLYLICNIRILFHRYKDHICKDCICKTQFLLLVGLQYVMDSLMLIRLMIKIIGVS